MNLSLRYNSSKNAETKILENKASENNVAQEKNKPIADDEKINRKHRSQAKTTVSNTEPQPAFVQVMDKNGKLEQRKIVIGVSNRVQVQVLEGLVEGEKVVSGIRLQESNAKEKAVSGQGAMGASGGAARMMR